MSGSVAKTLRKTAAGDRAVYRALKKAYKAYRKSGRYDG